MRAPKSIDYSISAFSLMFITDHIITKKLPKCKY